MRCLILAMRSHNARSIPLIELEEKTLLEDKLRSVAYIIKPSMWDLQVYSLCKGFCTDIYTADMMNYKVVLQFIDILHNSTDTP